jgi:hypothetical protein
VVVRRSVVRLWSALVRVGIDESVQRHKATFAETKLGAWISGDVLRTLVSNLCELVKVLILFPRLLPYRRMGGVTSAFFG